MENLNSMAALWGAVIFSGIYHGFNPAMGWPLAVSAALFERKKSALFKATIALGIGHLLSMLIILLPFSILTSFIIWESEIRIAAGLLVMSLGVYLLINNRHPKFLARIPPSKLALWSFLAALAHGAGLMLVPIFLGLCAPEDFDTGHQAAQTLMGSKIETALVVALIHTLAMSFIGAFLAIIVYFWLGLKFISKTWFNLDAVWAISLILVGANGLFTAINHT